MGHDDIWHLNDHEQISFYVRPYSLFSVSFEKKKKELN